MSVELNLEQLIEKLNIEGYMINLYQGNHNVDGAIVPVWYCHLRKELPLGILFQDFGYGETAILAIGAAYCKAKIEDGTIKLHKIKVPNHHKGSKIDVAAILAELDLSL